MIIRLGIAGIIAVFGCFGCRSATSLAGSVQVTVDTLDGVERVTSTGEAIRWSSSQVTRIGAAAGDGPDVFGRIRDIALDMDFNVYVADGQSSRIQVFDSIGRYVRTIGRRGAGPGEFEALYALGWFSDTLAVLDWRNARIGRFLRGGTWVGAWRWQPLSGGDIRLLNGSPTDLYAPVVRGRTGKMGFLHLGSETPDTLPYPDAPSGPSGPVCRYPNNSGIRFFGIPFGPTVQLAGGQDGTLLTGWSGDYRIARYRQKGDTVRIIERVRDPVPILDAEWNEATAEYRRIDEEYPGTVCDPREQPRPDSKPAFRWMGLDFDGRLWVEAYATDGFVFEIFDDNGHLSGQIDAPARDPMVAPVIRGDRLAVVTLDSLDVHYVEVYRIAP